VLGPQTGPASLAERTSGGSQQALTVTGVSAAPSYRVNHLRYSLA
jgi:hypothetical protein